MRGTSSTRTQKEVRLFQKVELLRNLSPTGDTRWGLCPRTPNGSSSPFILKMTNHQRSEISENRRSKAGGDQPEPHIAGAEVWAEPVSVGGPHARRTSGPCLAAQHAKLAARKVIRHFLRVPFVILLPASTTPLEDISAHIGRATFSVAAGENTHCGSGPDSCPAYITSVRREIAIPGIDARVGVAGGPLPLASDGNST